MAQTPKPLLKLNLLGIRPYTPTLFSGMKLGFTVLTGDEREL